MRVPRVRCGPWVLLAALATPLPAAPSDPSTPSAPSDPLDALMSELAHRRHGHVSFTEVEYLAVLERPLESAGELLYDAPDRLEKRTFTPRPETLVLAHGILSATRAGHTRTLALASAPQLAPLLESLRATLAGDRAALESLFSVRLEADPPRWTLHLTPRDPAAVRLVAEVVISGERSDLQTVEILEADGDRSRLTLGRELSP